MTLKVTNNLDFKRLTTEMQANLANELGTALADETRNIVKRTQAGQTIDGTSMKPYTREYAAFKGGTGRSKRTGKTKRFYNSVSKSTKPDLTFSGQMLRAITFTILNLGNKIQGKIFFTSADVEARAQANNIARPFFGLSTEQQKRISERMNRALKA